MPGFNTLPAVGGGGGQANMTFVGSIHMETYNRSWTQGGTPGYYALYSTNQENGYAYFVGATTTGAPLNRLSNITHSFTRIDIIAPQNDMVSLYKSKVKSTTEFQNAFAGFSSFPSVISSSGNFVLPNNALPLVNVLLCGGGGAAGRGHTSHGGGGGGAGGGVVKLTAYQAVGTTSVLIGSATSSHGHNGGQTYFGNVYARGGGYGAGHNGDSADYYKGADVANFGGNGGYQGGGHTQVVPTAPTATTGLGYAGSPTFHSGFHGGRGPGGNDGHNRGGGGGGAGGNGENGGNNSGANGGLGHASDISGSNISYGAGGQGHGAHGGGGTSGWDRVSLSPVGHGAHSVGGTNNDGSGAGIGRVVVRYYIP